VHYVVFLKINYSTFRVKFRVRFGLGLVLVLIRNITTANGLSYVVSIDYKNMVWCTFQVDPGVT